jgi:hypothetical protein
MWVERDARSLVGISRTRKAIAESAPATVATPSPFNGERAGVRGESVNLRTFAASPRQPLLPVTMLIILI